MLIEHNYTKPTGLIVVFWMILLLWWSACTTAPDDPGFDNPLDPTTGEYIAPETTILSGPGEGAIVDDHSVTFAWTGNANVGEYAYGMGSAGWSSWQTDTTVTFTYLDDGDYTFAVKGRYISGIEDSTAATRSFTIDDIQGPAMWLSPRKVAATTNQPFTVNLMIEDVTDLMVVNAQLEFSPGTLTLNSYDILDTNGDFLAKNAGSVVAFVDSSLAQGKIAFNLALMGATPPGLDGSGAILALNFTSSYTGSTSIAIGTGSTIIGSDLGAITLSELAGTTVEVGP